MTRPFLACDMCGAGKPRRILESPRLDGPLVECVQCGFRYVGFRRSELTFGSSDSEETADRLRAANLNIRHLPLEEEHRLATLNARWRLDLIKQYRSGGRLLEVGCARGDFLEIARDSFEVFGVEPNPDLAQAAQKIAPIYGGVVETLPWTDFDVAVSFHVIEHVDSPSRYVEAIAHRMKPGGLLVLETPDIDSVAFRIAGKRWRQFIPEHYFFFDAHSMTQLLNKNGFDVQQVRRIGKHASVALLMNRLGRYWRPLHYVERVVDAVGLSKLTFRLNPQDILIVVARKRARS